MRLGVFGGSFDPVHYGHLLLAEWCREACALDEVWLVPAASAPHKPRQAAAPGFARLEMVKLALGGHQRLLASSIELDRGGVSYTAETLAAIADERPDAELYFLLGGDSLVDLPTWREPARICALARLAVVRRAGNPEFDFAPLAELLQGKPPPAIVEMPTIELSSREIRRRVATGGSIRFQTPRAVEAYIEANRLYRETARDS